MIWDEDEGSIRYKGIRYLVIRPETLSDLFKAVEPVAGARAGEALFKGGFTGGNLSTKAFREIHGLSDEETIDFMLNMGGQIGWGRFSLETWDRGSEVLAVRVTNSPFAEGHGDADAPVCHLLRGIVAGMGSALLGRECGAVETSCEAMGDGCCRFVLDTGEGIKRDGGAVEEGSGPRIKQGI